MTSNLVFIKLVSSPSDVIILNELIDERTSQLREFNSHFPDIDDFDVPPRLPLYLPL